jgi:hypothetical protein
MKVSDVGAFVRVYFTAEFTESVLEAMEWEDPGESSKKTEMSGELASGNLVLTPDSDMLAKHEIEFSFFSGDKFFIVTIEKDDVKRREVRFFVDSNAPEAATSVFAYMNNLNKATGSLKLNYQRQGDLEL